MRSNGALVKSLLPARPTKAHKGLFGKVLIIAGSSQMAGAAVLCARAALKTGAGVVALALPKSRQCVAAAALPEMLTVGLPERSGLVSLTALPVIKTFIGQFSPSVILIGPGMGNTSFILSFLKQNRLPVIIDADALNVLSSQKNRFDILKKNIPLICTPHPGEMKRLLKKTISSDKEKRIGYANELSQKTGGISLLKGFETVISDGKKYYINPTGGPALAKGGSGDTLGGMIAGLWAQIGTAERFDLNSAFKSAVCGAYLHGLCGDLAAKKYTERCVLATDLTDQLPYAFRQLQRKR